MPRLPILVLLCWIAMTLASCGAPASQGGTPRASTTPQPTPLITKVWEPGSLAVGSDGTLYATDCTRGRIFAIDPEGVVSIFAGAGHSSTSGAIPVEGMLATEADIHCPAGIGFDAAGNLIIVEHASNRIRSIGADGTINTIVGGGPPGTSTDDGDLAGDGGPALEATLQEPVGIAFDAAGNLYFADRDNHAVRKVDASGIILTVAGTGEPGYSGDGGPAVAAQLERPQDVAVDEGGNLYITDSVNNRIRRVDIAGTITTFAGTGESGYSGDGGPATDAMLANPVEVVIARSGEVYFSSDDNHAVRKVDANGIISTVAGTGEPGFAGDGGPATEAQLQFPSGIVFDGAGNLYIGDSTNHRIRAVTPEGVISSYAPREE
jgi:sugar lactone lactonase YvrE